jgi:hypothetical protein
MAPFGLLLRPRAPLQTDSQRLATQSRSDGESKSVVIARSEKIGYGYQEVRADRGEFALGLLRERFPGSRIADGSLTIVVAEDPWREPAFWAVDTKGSPRRSRRRSP